MKTKAILSAFIGVSLVGAIAFGELLDKGSQITCTPSKTKPGVQDCVAYNDIKSLIKGIVDAEHTNYKAFYGNPARPNDSEDLVKGCKTVDVELARMESWIRKGRLTKESANKDNNYFDRVEKIFVTYNCDSVLDRSEVAFQRNIWAILDKQEVHGEYMYSLPAGNMRQFIQFRPRVDIKE